MEWKKYEKNDYRLDLDNSQREWFQLYSNSSSQNEEKSYILLHREGPLLHNLDGLCAIFYEKDKRKLYLASCESRIRDALQYKDVLLNAEGLEEKDREGLTLLLEKAEEACKITPWQRKHLI